MKLDDALLRVGGYGRFQLLCYSVIGFVCMRGVWHLLSIFFIGYATPHSCAVPPNSSLTLAPCDESACPCEPDKCSLRRTNGNGTLELVPCPAGWRYDGAWVSGWHLALDYETTIVREWNLVCDNNYLVDLSTTIFMAGVLCGAVLITPLSDKYGRKKVLFPCLWLQGALGIGLAFVSDFVQFAILRFFIGALNQAIALVGYVYMVEIFPPSHRTMPSVGLQIFWSVGIMLLALFAFLLKNWRYLELAISIPCLAFVPIYWLVPESVVWLVSVGKLHSAERVLERAARVNGCSDVLPPHCLVNEAECVVTTGGRATAVNRRGRDCKEDSSAPAAVALGAGLGQPSTKSIGIGNGDQKQTDRSTSEGLTVTWSSTETVTDDKQPDRLDSTVAICGDSNSQKVKEVDEAELPKHTVLDLFRTPVIRRYTLSMFVIWFVNSMDYLGLSLAISDLHGDKYLNFFLSGVVELPAYIVGALLVNRVGRKKPLFAFMLLSGVANVLTAVIPLAFSADCQDVTTKWLITAIALVGKFGISGSFCIVFLFASEIFPTSIRNIGVGVCSFWDTIGGMVAPQVNYAASVIPWLPRTIFGACAIAGAAFVLLLPETHNKKLPDDVKDVEKLDNGKGSWSL